MDSKNRSFEKVSIYTDVYDHDGGGGRCRPQRCFDQWKAAMTYTPMQPWEKLYDPENALKQGTMFPSLDLPFAGGGRK